MAVLTLTLVRALTNCRTSFRTVRPNKNCEMFRWTYSLKDESMIFYTLDTTIKMRIISINRPNRD